MEFHEYRTNENIRVEHGHAHGSIDPSIVTTNRGLWAVKWSFFGLMITFLLQGTIVLYTGSIALLADTIHNLGDAVTAVPLGIAFLLARKKPSEKFTFGYGRVEDLAGIVIVIIILFSAVVAGYQAIERIINPREIVNIWAVIVAAIIGFIGNEAVAIFRIKVGKEIGSAALIADGYHARIDGFTSLGVLLGAVGVILGFPLADPIVGLLISITIFKIVWDSIKTVFLRILDGIEPQYIDGIRHSLGHVKGIKEIVNIKARWSGHRILAEVFIKVSPGLTLMEAHEIVEKSEKEIMDHLSYVGEVVIDIEPDQ